MPKQNPPPVELLEYATEEARKKLELWIELGSSEKAGKVLGVSPTAVRSARYATERKAAKKGFTQEADHSRFIPEGQKYKGQSVMVDQDGEVKLRWIKTDEDKQRQEDAMREVMDELCQGIKPFKRVASPKKSLSELCTVYTITDYHVGAYSWKEETGADWDIDIAEGTLLKGISDLMNGSPDSDQAVFCQMGDFLHWDGLLAVTPTANNVLDADTRYPLLVQVAIRLCIRAVEMLLHKHKHVHVVICEGNHDLTGSVWLQAIMRVAFKQNERVTVDDSVFPYYSFVWGNTFLGWHHGHLARINRLASKFFSEPRFRKQLANAEYIYLATGHFHTKEVREESGAVIERHPTLNARDAHGARGFDHSQRGAIAITYSKKNGETTRITVVPQE